MEQKIKNIQCVICDVDGVLTDGSISLDVHGNESRTFHVHDGMGLVLLLAAGIEVAIITTTNNAIIDKRMQQIGIRYFYKGQIDKLSAYHDLKTKLNLPDNAFAYVGDDLPDIPVMQQVGFSVAVANARNAVKKVSDWQTQRTGGTGAVRELCDIILDTQDKTEFALKHYLQL